MQRVIAYIDGFNLYYGLKTKGWKRYYWLNIQALAQKLLKPNQKLVCTKYFTSRVSATPRDPGKSRRQVVYLEALQTLPAFEMFYGHYLLRQTKCWKCGAAWDDHEEKMTDVNIAVELMTDAFGDNFDTAIIVSGDSDLSGPIEAVHRIFIARRIVVAFPPERVSRRLKNVADSSFIIGRKTLADSQFPDEVPKPDGFILRRPEEWR